MPTVIVLHPLPHLALPCIHSQQQAYAATAVVTGGGCSSTWGSACRWVHGTSRLSRRCCSALLNAGAGEAAVPVKVDATSTAAAVSGGIADSVPGYALHWRGSVKIEYTALRKALKGSAECIICLWV